MYQDDRVVAVASGSGSSRQQTAGQPTIVMRYKMAKNHSGKYRQQALQGGRIKRLAK
jgi:hypothetical protein